MRGFIVIVIALFIFSACNEQIDQGPKNVLFILADDLGNFDLGIQGSSYYETPHIDQIAKEGTVFEQGYACSRVCSPSRASIMSGKYVARHGITDWIGAKTGEDWSQLNRCTQLLPPPYRWNLDHNYTSLAEVAQGAGYKTFFAGKWHLGSEGSYPEDHGFDINKGGWESGGPKGGYFSPYQNPKLENEADGEYLPIRLARETNAFLEQHQEEPFFAFLSFYAVHGPNQTDQERWEKYQKKAMDNEMASEGFVMEKRLPIRTVQDNPIYAGLVDGMDTGVGMVLDKLKELGLSENTMVVFTSDNGGVASGDDYSTSNLPLRGGKGYQWEGGIRVPYFIKVPWMKDQVSRQRTPVTGADFYPTVLDILSIDQPEGEDIDGVSLKPLLQGEAIADRTLYWHYPHYGNQGGDPSSIIREDKWKLIHYWEDGTNELYDLNADEIEQNNIADQFPEITKNLYSKLNAYLTSHNASVPSPDPRYDPTLEIERLNMIENEKLPSREKERKDFLKEDFVPNEDWWGSTIKSD